MMRCECLPGLLGVGYLSEAIERFGADMMLDALGIYGGSFLADTDGEQEAIDQIVSFSAVKGESLALGCEFNGAMSFGDDQSLANESLDNAHHGDMTDAEAFSKVRDAAGLPGFDYGRDRFHIVLGRLGGVVFAGSGMGGGRLVLHGVFSGGATLSSAGSAHACYAGWYGCLAGQTRRDVDGMGAGDILA
jgi:hypothetical protein